MTAEGLTDQAPTPVRMFGGHLANLAAGGANNATPIGTAAAAALGPRLGLAAWADHLEAVPGPAQGAHVQWTAAVASSALVEQLAPAVYRYFSAGAVIAPHAQAPAARRPLDEVVGTVADGLRLTRAALARLLSVPRTSLYRSLADPARRGASDAVERRATFVADLVEAHQPAAALLVESRPAELTDALARDDYLRVLQLFAESRAQWAALAARSYSAAIQGVDQATPDVRRLLREPGFADAVRLVAELSPADAAPSVDRAEAFIDLDDALRAARTGDEVPEQWAFLHTLSREEREALRRRAFAVLRTEDFGPVRWQRFVSAESARAWASYQVTELQPIEAEELPAVDDGRDAWGLDLAPGRRPAAFDRRR